MKVTVLKTTRDSVIHLVSIANVTNDENARFS